MASHRIETDSLGPVEVPTDRYYGAQTARSLHNFKIGGERFPVELIQALAIIKMAAALANSELGLPTNEMLYLPTRADRKSTRLNSSH